MVPLKQPEFSLSKVRVLLSNDDFLFELHEYRRGADRLLFAHITFHRFTPSILKSVLKRWKVFRRRVTVPIFAHAGDGDLDKWVRFVSLLGFKTTGKSLSFINGQQRPVFIHLGPDADTWINNHYRHED